MYSVLRLPENESYFDESFRDYIDKYITLWRNAHIEAPLPHKLYTDSDQHDFEYETGRMINFIDKDFRKYPAKERQQSAWRERMIKSLRKFAITSFQFPEKHCDIIFSREYLASTIEFIHQGREFDQHMQPEELAQALRNVWVMNCLQLFMGRRPSLTPSIFAYSMLYPYTDNHLDNPDLSIETKELACRRLGLRLSGQPLDPCNPHEAAVFHLISMIEGDFPRALFPEVYSSLLAIHSGQVQSLKQQHQTDLLDEQQLLRISVTKGGSSDVFRELPMEFAVEAQNLLNVSLEGAVG